VAVFDYAAALIEWNLVPVNRARSRPVHRNTRPAKGYRPLLGAVAYRDPVRVLYALRPTRSVSSASNIVCITASPAATLIAKSPSRAAPAISLIASAIYSGRSGNTTASVLSATRTVGMVFISGPLPCGCSLVGPPETYHAAGLRWGTTTSSSTNIGTTSFGGGGA
jgi:hypothetical protein